MYQPANSFRLPPAATALLAFVIPMLMGCQLVEGIFKAGVWVTIVVIAIAAALLFGVTRLFSRGT